jgi:hypothetical protein
VLPRQLQHFHRGVVVVHHLRLRPLADQLLVSRPQIGRGSLYQLPLGRRGHRDAHRLLELLDPVEGCAGTVLQQSHHTGGCGIVLLLTDPGRGVRRIDFPTQIAAQPITGIHPRAQGGHACDTHPGSGLGQPIHLASLTRRTGFPTVQRRMRDADLLGARVGCRTQTAVAGFGLGIRWLFSGLS